jgi:hypothetical protein
MTGNPSLIVAQILDSIMAAFSLHVDHRAFFQALEIHFIQKFSSSCHGQPLLIPVTPFMQQSGCHLFWVRVARLGYFTPSRLKATAARPGLAWPPQFIDGVAPGGGAWRRSAISMM